MFAAICLAVIVILVLITAIWIRNALVEPLRNPGDEVNWRSVATPLLLNTDDGLQKKANDLGLGTKVATARLLTVILCIGLAVSVVFMALQTSQEAASSCPRGAHGPDCKD